MEYTRTQPDEVRYIAPATYNLHFIIPQITTAQGIALDCANKWNMAQEKAPICAKKWTIKSLTGISAA